MTASQQVRVVVGLGLVAVLLVGCGRLTSPPAASSSSAPLVSVSPYPSSSFSGTPPVPVPVPAAVPAPDTVNGADVDAVALAAVRAIESSDTRLDADPNDTVKRASAWLTPAFAAQVRAYPPVAAPGATWNLWAAHRAYLKVMTSLAGDDHPIDSATAAYRQVVAVLHPVGRDGWAGPTQTAVVFVALAPVHGQWRLSSEQSN